MSTAVTKPSASIQVFDFLVFIGRFQPFHLGHLKVIEQGLKQAKQLIVLCGSAHQPRSTRNPWTVEEREQMIRGALTEEQNRRLHFAPLMDIVYNDETWVRNVQATVNGIVTAHHPTPHKQANIGLIGHSKDESSYYLKLFPQWRSVQVENYKNLCATPLREAMFVENQTDAGACEKFLTEKGKEAFPSNVQTWLQQFCNSDEYGFVRDEHNFVAKYRKAWEQAPYEPTFVTVDAVVVQSGHILLVERNARPGKGLLALPGGFIGAHERLADACLRELREETRLKVPAPVLKGSIKGQEVFDDPYRSARGRTITHAFYIELEPNKELPKVKGGDDAKHAMWVPLAELDPKQLFEDHYFIIQEMIGSF